MAHYGYEYNMSYAGCYTVSTQMQVQRTVQVVAVAVAVTVHISDLEYRSTPQVFYKSFYNQAQAHRLRLRLEKVLYIKLSRSSNGFFLTTSGSKWRFQKRNGRYVTVSEEKVLQLHIFYT